MFQTDYTYEFESGHIELKLEIDQDERGFFVWDVKTDLKNDLPSFMNGELVKKSINKDLNQPLSKSHGLCIDHFGFEDETTPLRRDYYRAAAQ